MQSPRALRLQADYLHAEVPLRAHDVRHAVVVFGSTRATGRYYDMARELGRLVATGGRADNLALMTGGGPGIMEAANRGALEAGGLSIGLNIELPEAQAPNQFVTPGLTFNFRYFALRKLHFMLRARALVAFPGGYGTFDEIFETLMLVQTGRLHPLPVVLVGEGFWGRAFDADFLVAEGMIDAADRALFRYAESAAEAWEIIRAWYPGGFSAAPRSPLTVREGTD